MDFIKAILLIVFIASGAGYVTSFYLTQRSAAHQREELSKFDSAIQELRSAKTALPPAESAHGDQDALAKACKSVGGNFLENQKCLLPEVAQMERDIAGLKAQVEELRKAKNPNSGTVAPFQLGNLGNGWEITKPNGRIICRHPKGDAHCQVDGKNARVACSAGRQKVEVMRKMSKKGAVKVKFGCKGSA